jgi:hypothetical protein
MFWCFHNQINVHDTEVFGAREDPSFEKGSFEEEADVYHLRNPGAHHQEARFTRFPKKIFTTSSFTTTKLMIYMLMLQQSLY